MRIWVRPDTKIIVSLGFSRVSRGAPDTARAAVLYGYAVPISEQVHSREFDPYKEKTSLPGTTANVSEFVCVTALGTVKNGTNLRVRVREY